MIVANSKYAYYLIFIDVLKLCLSSSFFWKFEIVKVFFKFRFFLANFAISSLTILYLQKIRFKKHKIFKKYEENYHHLVFSYATSRYRKYMLLIIN